METTNNSWDEDQVIASAEEAPVSTNVQTIQELYLAYYGRPADPEGLDFWVAKMEELDDLDALIAGFTNSEESALRVKTGTETQQIDAMHQNLFGRNVDTAKLVEWTAQLDAGTITLGQIAHAMTQGGNATDKAIFANKMAVANSFTQSVKESGKAFTAGQIEAIRTVLVDVNADTDVAAISFADIVAAFADFVEGTLSLTSGVDRLQGSSEDTVFTAVAGFSSDTSLNTGDQITGGRGANSIEISMEGSFNGVGTEGFVRDVQQVFVESNGFSANTFDATNFFGVDAYHLLGEQGISDLSNVRLNSDGQLTVKSKDNMSFNLSISGPQETQGDDGVAQNPEFEVPEGVKTNLTLMFNGAGVKANPQLEINQEIVDVSIRELSLDTVTLDVSGVNVLGFSQNESGNDTLKVKGAGELILTSVGAGTEKVDASEATGNITADLTGSTSLTSVTLGSGNDTVTLGSASVLATLNGGEGSNTLVFTGDVAGTLKPTATNFQTIKFDGLNNAMTLAADNVAGLERLQLAEGFDKAVTAANLRVNDLVAEVQGAQAGGSLITDNRAQLAVDIKAGVQALADRATEGPASTGITAAQANSLVVNARAYTQYDGGIAASKASQVTLAVESGRDEAGLEQTVFEGTINATEAKLLNVNASGQLDGATVDAGKLENANITVGQIRESADAFASHSLTLNASELRTLTVNNNGNLQLISGANGFTKLQSLTVTAGQGFELDAGTESLEAIRSVTLSGSREDSKVVLGDLGREGLDVTALDVATASITAQAINVSATGLASGLEIGAISSVGVNKPASTSADNTQTFNNVTLSLTGLRGRETGDGATDNSVGTLTGNNITVSANGMRASREADGDAGLLIEGIQAKGRVDLNFSNARANIEVGAIGVAIDDQGVIDGTDAAAATQNVTITANGMLGNLEVGTIDVAVGRAITINASNMTGDVALGGMAVAENDGAATGSITVNLEGTTGRVDDGDGDGFTLKARDVTINARSLLDGFTDADGDAVGIEIEAGNRVVVNASEINDNTFEITGKTITYVGGIKDDTITINGLEGERTTATITGGLGDDVFTFAAGVSDGELRVTIIDWNSDNDTIVAVTSYDGTTDEADAADVLKEFGFTNAKADDITLGTISMAGTGEIEGLQYANRTFVISNDDAVLIELVGSIDFA